MGGDMDVCRNVKGVKRFVHERGVDSRNVFTHVRFWEGD